MRQCVKPFFFSRNICALQRAMLNIATVQHLTMQSTDTFSQCLFLTWSRPLPSSLALNSALCWSVSYLTCVCTFAFEVKVMNDLGSKTQAEPNLTVWCLFQTDHFLRAWSFLGSPLPPSLTTSLFVFLIRFGYAVGNEGSSDIIGRLFSLLGGILNSCLTLPKRVLVKVWTWISWEVETSIPQTYGIAALVKALSFMTGISPKI